MFSYNISTHEGTKFTPHELVYGRKARLPSSIPPTDNIKTYPDYVDELIHKLHHIRQMARNNLEESKNRQKHYYDRKIQPQTYQEGDWVWLLNPRREKLEPEYSGPYKITEVLENSNLKIVINPKQMRVVHIVAPGRFHRRPPRRKGME